MFIGRHLAEEIDVGHQIALGKAVFAQFNQQGLAAADVTRIALLLKTRVHTPLP